MYSNCPIRFAENMQHPHKSPANLDYPYYYPTTFTTLSTISHLCSLTGQLACLSDPATHTTNTHTRTHTIMKAASITDPRPWKKHYYSNGAGETDARFFPWLDPPCLHPLLQLSSPQSRNGYIGTPPPPPPQRHRFGTCTPHVIPIISVRDPCYRPPSFNRLRAALILPTWPLLRRYRTSCLGRLPS